MGNRCLHELNTDSPAEVAKQMELDSFSNSIEEIDLGSSVLTLNEVMQTFEVESTMYNIKLPQTSIDYRTVILTKNRGEVDGACKLLVMINDVTDRVRLE